MYLRFMSGISVMLCMHEENPYNYGVCTGAVGHVQQHNWAHRRQVAAIHEVSDRTRAAVLCRCRGRGG